MEMLRVNITLDSESKRLLHEEAASHKLSLSAWLRVVAETLKLPAPPDMPMSVLRSEVRQIIERERAHPMRNKGH